MTVDPTEGKKAALADLLMTWVRDHVEQTDGMPVLGLSGAQGIGKTTALRHLETLPNLKVAVLSLDDFYLTKAERQHLAASVHPLCATRGAPGSHDVELLIRTIDRLRLATGSSIARWPSFDKKTDDRAAERDWCELQGRPDAVLLEGWMIGALPDTEAKAAPPCNELEAKEDPTGRWRDWQERSLSKDYLPLWDKVDGFLHLVAPSFDVVMNWRCQQEETTLGLAPGTLPADRRQWVARFIQHYERITRRMLAGERMPGAHIEISDSRHILDFML